MSRAEFDGLAIDSRPIDKESFSLTIDAESGTITISADNTDLLEVISGL